jgi:hypothetical protein
MKKITAILAALAFTATTALAAVTTETSCLVINSKVEASPYNDAQAKTDAEAIGVAIKISMMESETKRIASGLLAKTKE